MFPESGQKLGPYEILDELGGGGMAKVFRAWDGCLHREVAIKVFVQRDAMTGPRERLPREAHAARALNHPNICTIFDIGEQDNAPYLVMELLEGETLKARIGRFAMRPEDILRHAAEVADTLAAAHSRGIIHGDIRPANIFFVKKRNGTSHAKVLGFGLVNVEQFAGEQRGLAMRRTTIGATDATAAYMSPEQVRGEDLDARSDLFSLGVVMYEMATGKLPFVRDGGPLDFAQRPGENGGASILTRNAEILNDLQRVILKLLVKEPGARLQTASELREELQDIADRRSGWLTRMKNPPADDSTLPGEPVSPAVPLDPSPGPYLPPRPAQTPQSRATREDLGSSQSTVARSGRSSIAFRPRFSFPTVAPYSGQTSAQMCAAPPASIGESDFATVETAQPSPILRAGNAAEVHGPSPETSRTSTAAIVAVAAVSLALAAGLIAWSMGWSGRSPS